MCNLHSTGILAHIDITINVKLRIDITINVKLQALKLAVHCSLGPLYRASCMWYVWLVLQCMIYTGTWTITTNRINTSDINMQEHCLQELHTLTDSWCDPYSLSCICHGPWPPGPPDPRYQMQLSRLLLVCYIDWYNSEVSIVIMVILITMYMYMYLLLVLVMYKHMCTLCIASHLTSHLYCWHKRLCMHELMDSCVGRESHCEMIQKFNLVY